MNIKLREVRKNAHVTQGDLAKMVGVDVKTVGNWERGVTVMNLEQVCDCAIALGCTPNDLCGWYEDNPRQDDARCDDPYTRELVDCFEASSDEGRRTIINVARSTRATTGEEQERGDSDAEEVA